MDNMNKYTYQITLWEEAKTPLSAANLNNIEQGIELSHQRLDLCFEKINALRIDLTTKVGNKLIYSETEDLSQRNPVADDIIIINSPTEQEEQ